MKNTRTILITGASSGIGRHLAERLLDEGHIVLGLARRFEQTPESQPRFHPIACDLEDLDKLPAVLEQLIKRFPALDAIVCNAGRGHFCHLEEMSLAQIRSLMDLNFLSHVFLIKTLLPLLKQKKGGDILFIGSEAALAGKRKGSIYCASKFALRGFAQALREECAPAGVRVCSVQPGMVATPFYDNLDFSPGEEPSHALQAEDIAQAVLMALHLRHGAACDEIRLSPLKKVIRFAKKETAFQEADTKKTLD